MLIVLVIVKTIKKNSTEEICWTKSVYIIVLLSFYILEATYIKIWDITSVEDLKMATGECLNCGGNCSGMNRKNVK